MHLNVPNFIILCCPIFQIAVLAASNRHVVNSYLITEHSYGG